MTKKLTELAVKNWKHTGTRQEVRDGLIAALYLIVQPSPSTVKSWAYRPRINGKPSKITFGKWPAVSLAGARKLAQEMQLKICRGEDPTAKTPKREEKTVEQLARDFVQMHCVPRNRPGTLRETLRILGLERDPHTGELRLTQTKGEVLSKWQHRRSRDITAEDVIDVTDAIFARAPIQANRTLAVIRSMFSWAISRKWVAANPCDGLRAPGKENARRRVLRPEELRAVWRATERLDAPARDAYRLLILSGQRKSQVATARLEDFDFREMLWTMPPEQAGNKNEVPHVLPITDEIARIVRACPHRQGYLFGGSKPLNLGSAIKNELDALVLDELRVEAAGRGDDPAQVKLEPWRNHDLRRTMRTGLSSLAIPEGDIVRELVLGHKQKGIHDVYDQHSYLPEKKIALELWAARVGDIVSPLPANVVPIRATAGA